jgi:hypothetical protein
MLSFVLNAFGTDFIVDPGTYTYLEISNGEDTSKCIKAHNTVVVDDEDPVNIEEAFEISGIPFTQIKDHLINEKHVNHIDSIISY